MARRQKPEGYEHWTWEEIRVGRRMSKAEKRGRRMAKCFGATEDSAGNIRPPEGEGRAAYFLIYILMAILMILVAVFSKQ